MVALIAHGFAHRILSDGSIESAPAVVRPDTGSVVIEGPWERRSAEEKDLTGGDEEILRLQLEELARIFGSDEPRLPKMKPGMPVVTEEAVVI